MSHAELDEAEELDEGDPAELGARHRELRAALPAMRVARRLLRHRPSARRGDRRRLARAPDLTDTPPLRRFRR